MYARSNVPASRQPRQRSDRRRQSQLDLGPPRPASAQYRLAIAVNGSLTSHVTTRPSAGNASAIHSARTR